MAPSIPSATANLSYPLFCVDFDEEDSRYLLVGGGGGESKSGVKNKITLLDASSKTELSELTSIELSSGEDSVSSLVTARSFDASAATVFAGINSSTADQEAGNNEHFRTFKVAYPPLKAASAPDEKGAKLGGTIEELSRKSWFRPADAKIKETYQRIVRISSPRGQSRRLIVLATGLAPSGELLCLLYGPDGVRERARLSLGKGIEAGGVDVINKNGDGEPIACYCTEREVSIFNPAEKQRPSENPLVVYVQPHPDFWGNPQDRPSFRSLRFLKPHLLLLLANYPGKKAAEILVLCCSEEGKLGNIIARKRLHTGCKATALDVSILDNSAQTQSQFVIAVGDKNGTVAVYTLDWKASFGISNLKKFALLRASNASAVGSLVFSNFRLLDTSTTDAKAALPQHLKLASVGIVGTVTVHTLPLTPVPPRSRTPRYVLSAPGQGPQQVFSVVFSLVVVLLGAVLLQAFLEIRGGSPEYLEAKKWLSPAWQERIARPYVMENVMPNISAPSDEAPATPVLSHLLGKAEEKGVEEKEHAVLISVPHEEGDVEADVHAVEHVEGKGGRKWEDLGHKEREWWEKKLRDGGMWAENEVETVLKSVFFGEVAGLVGQVVGGL